MISSISLWHARDGVLVPKSATSAAQIADYAKQLTVREKSQLVNAFQSGNFEMGSVFVWSRSMAALKKQLSSIGGQFIGEMLDRPDLASGSSVAKMITDYEAVTLAEELGMFNGTQAMRLRHAMELVAHFAEPPEPTAEDGEREMMPEEAVHVLRACVQSVLGHEQLGVALEFARFRNQLEERTFAETDEEIGVLAAAPSFFRTTTVRVLMALVKTTQSAQLEHSLANANVILPVLWNGLYKPDRWLVGRTYAEVHAAGKRTAASGLKQALLKVNGFDYVPEDLRSRAFIGAAKKILDAHFEFNNFYNETAPMEALATLGTVIPMPGFPACMRAVLCVHLGNTYGVSWAAQDAAERVLRSVSGDRWTYFLNECLPADEVLLAKLASSRPVARWFAVVDKYGLAKLNITDRDVRQLIEYSATRNSTAVGQVATKLANRTEEG